MEETTRKKTNKITSDGILFINNFQELDCLQSSYWTNKLRGADFSEIAVEFTQFDQRQNKTIQGKLNAYYFECGCGLGALFLVFTIISLIIIAVNSANLGWQDFVFGAVISISGALAGKVIGLTLAFRKLKKVISRLRSSFQSSQLIVDVDNSL